MEGEVQVAPAHPGHLNWAHERASPWALSRTFLQGGAPPRGASRRTCSPSQSPSFRAEGGVLTDPPSSCPAPHAGGGRSGLLESGLEARPPAPLQARHPLTAPCSDFLPRWASAKGGPVWSAALPLQGSPGGTCLLLAQCPSPWGTPPVFQVACLRLGSWAPDPGLPSDTPRPQELAPGGGAGPTWGSLLPRTNQQVLGRSSDCEDRSARSWGWTTSCSRAIKPFSASLVFISVLTGGYVYQFFREKHQRVTSQNCPDQGSDHGLNPQPSGVRDDTPTESPATERSLV